LPTFSLPDLKDPQRSVTTQDLVGEVAMLNVWATWCPSCAAEHKQLMRIADERVVRLVGIDYNDDLGKARQWLGRLGDPYSLAIADAQGTLGIDLGVYGAPETFVIDRSGTIRYRHVGAVTDEVWRETLRPLILELQGDGALGE
jgi:cytochrome c biogenesis protein CcmG/thiol:disulfide interchange protein DsbE